MNEQRVARVRAEMQAHGLTQMIISDSKSIWYLTGASVEPYERLMALYLPDAIRDRQYYQFGDNKNEQAAAAYWQRIKGDKFKK